MASVKIANHRFRISPLFVIFFMLTLIVFSNYAWAAFISDGTVKSSVKISDNENGGPTGLQINDGFGISVANIGDLDGDGVTDLVVGAFTDESTGGDAAEGAVFILFMNTDGTVKSNPAPVKISDGENGGPTGLESIDLFGLGVASIGDLNGDGITDLAVGAYLDEKSGGDSGEGALFILFMNTDGTVKSNPAPVKISDGENGGPTGLESIDLFGLGVASIGDLNGDGITDLAVGAYLDEKSGGDSGEGALFILFMNTDGTVKSSVKISDGENGGPSLEESDNFGVSVASIGDLNGDGITDLAVGAMNDEKSGGDSSEGALFILFMNTDGTVKSNPAPVKISDGENGGPTGLDASDNFGISVANIGDLNGDGVTDLAVGANADENAEASEGALFILFMNTDGTAKSNPAPVKISDGVNDGTGITIGLGDLFGTSVTNMGDLDDDGVIDLAVGAFKGESSGGDSEEGAVYILFMNTDGSAKSSVKISDNENGGPTGLDATDRFGHGVANIGDLNGDGITDLAVGAFNDESTGGNGGEGALFILFMNGNVIKPPSSGGDFTAPTIGKSSTGQQVVENGFSYQSNLGEFTELDADLGLTHMDSLKVAVGGIPDAPPGAINDQTRDKLEETGMGNVVNTFDNISNVISELGNFFNGPDTQDDEISQEPRDISGMLDNLKQDLSESKMEPDSYSNPEQITQINILLDKIVQKIKEIEISIGQ